MRREPIVLAIQPAFARNSEHARSVAGSARRR